MEIPSNKDLMKGPTKTIIWFNFHLINTIWHDLTILWSGWFNMIALYDLESKQPLGNLTLQHPIWQKHWPNWQHPESSRKKKRRRNIQDLCRTSKEGKKTVEALEVEMIGVYWSWTCHPKSHNPQSPGTPGHLHTRQLSAPNLRTKGRKPCGCQLANLDTDCIKTSYVLHTLQNCNDFGFKSLFPFSASQEVAHWVKQCT